MLVVVLGLFAVGSLVCALSSSLELLIAGRAIQGAAGAVFPLAFGIIRDEFPRERVATGIGLISATFGIGGGAGLVLSGLIVDHLSYEWIFWFGLVVVLIAVVATHLFVPESPIKSPGEGRLGRRRAAVRRAHGLAGRRQRGQPLGLGSPRDHRPVRRGRGAARGLGALRAARRRSRSSTSTCSGCAASGRPTSPAFLVGFGMFGSFILIPQFVQMPEASGYGFGVRRHRAPACSCCPRRRSCSWPGRWPGRSPAGWARRCRC